MLGLMATLYYGAAFAPCDPCAGWHRAIIAGTADSPHRYRVLAPFLVQTLFNPQDDRAIMSAYVLAHALALPAMFAALYLYWRRWVSQGAALAGVLFIAAYSPLMFAIYGISLNNPLEVITLSAGLLWLLSGRDGLLFAALVVIGALNRETGVILPIAYVGLRWRDTRRLRLFLCAGGYILVWAAVFVGVRAVIGHVPDQITVADVFKANTSSPWHMTNAAINLGVTVPVWALAALGVRGADARLRRIALAGLPYAALFAVFGLWNETRLLLPLFALWMPFALRYLSENRGIIALSM